MPVTIKDITNNHKRHNEGFLVEVEQPENTMIIIHAEWCGHCKKLALDIEELKKHSKNDITIYRLEESVGNVIYVKLPKKEIEQNAIIAQGYPTIMIYDKNNKTFVNYMGSRDYKTLDSLFNKMKGGKRSKRSKRGRTTRRITHRRKRQRNNTKKTLNKSRKSRKSRKSIKGRKSRK